MIMKDWREFRGLTMAEAAALLSIDHVGSYRRYETGENRPDAPLAVRIRMVSDGCVTLDDLHQQRLDWLREHRPEHLSAYPELKMRAAE